MHLYKYACSGHRKSAVYVGIELVDEEGRHVPDEDIKLTGNIELVEALRQQMVMRLPKTAGRP